MLSLHEWGNRLEAYPLMEYPVKEEMEDFYLFSTTEHARNADYVNPQELRVMQITTPGRDAYPSSRFTGTLITHHMERNPWHVPDALGVGRNSKNYWT